MRNSRFWRTCAWKLPRSLWVALFLGIAAVSAGETVNTTITSQKLTVRNQENKAIFEGAVVLTKGELVVHSDVMVVFFELTEPKSDSKKMDHRRSGKLSVPPTSSPSGDGSMPTMSNRTVSKIEATGRVRIEKGEGRATCHRALYYADEERIVLTGDPVAWEKGTRVAGNKITMYLAENRSVVEGESRVLIEPQSEGKP
jgi:lipopolysaccharide export system protein LptA